MAFLTAEDAALHEALKGVLVQDVQSLAKGEPREAKVKFRLAEDEMMEEHYPFISIDLVDLEKSARREHRGIRPLDYLPDEPEYEDVDLADVGRVTWPIPYDLFYQVTTYARYWQHDRAMQRGLLRGPFRERQHNYLVVGGEGVDTIHSEDATIRVMELMSLTPAHGRVNNKRLFRHIYTVRLESELPPAIVPLLTAPVSQVVITLEPASAEQLAAAAPAD